MISNLVTYYLTHFSEYWSAVKVHLILSFQVGIFAAVIAVPLGTLCVKYEKIAQSIERVMSMLRIIPSLALMIVFIPLMGIGKLPATVALLIIATPPIMINTTAGFKNIDAKLLEAAKGMGMNEKQIFWKVRVPQAIPLIFAGIRTSIVETIASATIAAYIGAGGLGNIIFAGLGINKTYMVALGGLSVAAISIATDLLLSLVQGRIEIRYGMVKKKQ